LVFFFAETVRNMAMAAFALAIAASQSIAFLSRFVICRPAEGVAAEQIGCLLANVNPMASCCEL
jgi:hypothetical protein